MSLERDREAALRWLNQRLSAPTGAGELADLLRGAWARLRSRPLATVLPPERVRLAFEAHWRAAQLEAVARVLAGAGLREATRQARADDAPLRRGVPDRAAEAILRVVGRPGVVPEAWVRAVFRQKAVEDVLADALYRGLRDFSTVLPRLVMRVLPSGRLFGAAGALGEKVASQLEALVEPEIKSFITTGSQKALERAAARTIEQLDSPMAIEMRRDLAQFVLDQSPRFHSHALEPEALEAIEAAAVAIAGRLPELEDVRDRAVAWIERVAEEHGDVPLGEVVDALGYDVVPAFEAVADVVFPAIAEALEAPEVQSWLGGLIDGLLDAAEGET
jgi:hypothetical protein